VYYPILVIQTEIKVPSSEASFVTGEITTLKLEDMEAINKLSNISESYAASIGQEKISYGGESKRIMIFGVSSPYQRIDIKTVLAEGNFFPESDDDSQALVVVLGSEIKKTLFGEQSAIDKFVTISNKKFRVLGVLEEQGGGFGFMDFNDMAYMPITTLHKRVLGIDHAMYFMHQVKDVSVAEDTASEIRYVLRERHDISDPEKDDFRVSTMAEMLDSLNIITDAITYLLLAIVLISLLVGGVGIMNIMYVTVSERTPEIGLRKALGATEKDITLQFLVEAMLITFWGWLVGAVLGLLISLLLNYVAKAFNLGWEYAFPFQGILVSLLFSIISGLLFGYRPAKQAAKLDPIVALRQE
jgi:putative ABC transport system permease protein